MLSRIKQSTLLPKTALRDIKLSLKTLIALQTSTIHHYRYENDRTSPASRTVFILLVLQLPVYEAGQRRLRTLRIRKASHIRVVQVAHRHLLVPIRGSKLVVLGRNPVLVLLGIRLVVGAGALQRQTKALASAVEALSTRSVGFVDGDGAVEVDVELDLAPFLPALLVGRDGVGQRLRLRDADLPGAVVDIRRVRSWRWSSFIAVGVA